jgi:hypothetical protein
MRNNHLGPGLDEGDDEDDDRKDVKHEELEGDVEPVGDRFCRNDAHTE